MLAHIVLASDVLPLLGKKFRQVQPFISGKAKSFSDTFDDKSDYYSFKQTTEFLLILPFLFQTHLWTFNVATLSRLADDLAPVAGTELTACAVPHVTMVTRRALIQAASLGGSAFITAMTSTPHFGLTLRGSSTVRLSLALFGFHLQCRWQRWWSPDWAVT